MNKLIVRQFLILGELNMVEIPPGYLFENRDFEKENEKHRDGVYMQIKRIYKTIQDEVWQVYMSLFMADSPEVHSSFRNFDHLCKHLLFL